MVKAKMTFMCSLTLGFFCRGDNFQLKLNYLTISLALFHCQRISVGLCVENEKNRSERKIFVCEIFPGDFFVLGFLKGNSKN